MEKIFGLLGCGISYTRSPQLHKALGGYDYKVFDITSDKLDQFFALREFDGINVTVPYKTQCIKYLDELSPIAKKLNAVNTIVKKDGKLIGYNTDYFGFLEQAQSLGIDYKGKTVLVLGNGGAAQAVIQVFNDLGVEKVLVCSRNGVLNYQNVYEISNTVNVIVNATPVGNSSLKCLVNLKKFANLIGVLDLVYTPVRTKLVLDALSLGKKATGGAIMLVHQAVKASELFVGEIGQKQKANEVYNQLVSSLSNLVLVGMAGCGKTTIGKILAEQTGRKFVDTDLLIEQKEGMSIPEIFNRFSERRFREIESEVISELYMQSGLIISTGGGAILRQENRDMLRANGKVVFIRRRVEDCEFKGRPLFETGNAEQVFYQRLPLYTSCADFSVDNNGSIEDCVKAIKEKL